MLRQRPLRLPLLLPLPPTDFSLPTPKTAFYDRYFDRDNL
jgi:hypothetical protein